MKDLLGKEPFDVEEFTKVTADAEQEIKDKQDDLIREFQRLESSCVLAMSHLPEGQTYAGLIADLRECGEEINKLRLLNARSILSIANGYCDSGVPLRELLIAAMQGVKNAALAYTFCPKVSFIEFAVPIIRRHIEQYIQDGESAFAVLYKEYKEILDNAKQAYHDYRNPECKAAMYSYSVQPETERAQLFATAKIDRCRNEIRKAAECVEWRQVDAATHLPDDYDERDKFIRTSPFMVHDALYSGECKDFVKAVADGEWYICTVPDGVRVPVCELTDRDSMRGALEALLDILEKIPWTRILKFNEWRAESGIFYEGEKIYNVLAISRKERKQLADLYNSHKELFDKTFLATFPEKKVCEIIGKERMQELTGAI